MENRILIISSKEYVLLAATAGMHHMYGFDMEADSISHAEAVMSLQDLTNKGYIKSNGDKFIIVGEMKLIFSIITIFLIITIISTYKNKVKHIYGVAMYYLYL